MEIWETEEEKQLSDRELKNINFISALHNFRGKSFYNRAINKDIHVSRDGLGEWKTVTKSRDQVLSIKILDVMLINADFWKEEPPKKPDPNIEKVVYLRQHCIINNNHYRAVITVKVYKSHDYHKYYHHYLNDCMRGHELELGK